MAVRGDTILLLCSRCVVAYRLSSYGFEHRPAVVRSAAACKRISLRLSRNGYGALISCARYDLRRVKVL